MLREIEFDGNPDSSGSCPQPTCEGLPIAAIVPRRRISRMIKGLRTGLMRFDMMQSEQSTSQRWTCCALLALLCVNVSTGCISTDYTELPSFQPRRHTAVERQFYRIHDPFTDDKLGPDLGVRPRGFARPRPETQRASEVYFGLGLPKYRPLPWPFNFRPVPDSGVPPHFH